jgi:hypothetical protein
LKYVVQIEVGKSKVIEGEEKKKKDEEERDEKNGKKKDDNDDKDREKDEKKNKEKEWEIVSGTWKEERMDAVSSFIAAVQHIGEPIGG